MIRLALVEDDPSVRDGVTLGMVNRGYAVAAYATGEAALEAVTSDNCDVIIVDLMLPGISGVEVCRTLRRRDENLSVVMLTARGDDSSMVEGLDAGADDYIVKPAEPRVIDARLRAVLRRASREVVVAEEPTMIGGLTVDIAGFRVLRDAEEMALSPTEMRLFLCLLENRGIVLSRGQLLEKVWGYDHFGDERVVDTTIQRLRTKVEADRNRPQLILTVRGFGYRLSAS